MAVTEIQIIQAAEAFVKEFARTPTYLELRAALGGGSPVTLNKYYRIWRSQKDAELVLHQAVNSLGVEKVPIPEPILEALTAL